MDNAPARGKGLSAPSPFARKRGIEHSGDTTKRQDVEPFCRNYLSDSFSHLINELLKLKVFLQSKVPGDLFTVIPWSDQCIASERRIFVQKH